MTATPVPTLLAGLIDDAAVFPPGNAPLPEAVRAHREHRTAWYRDLVGPLLVPASAVDHLPALLEADRPLAVGIIGDTGPERLDAILGSGLFTAAPDAAGPDRAAPDPAGGKLVLTQIEIAVAKRGEDPQPGLRRLADLAAGWPAVPLYAEIPLAWGLMAALDTVVAARDRGVAIAAKFRTGGLAAELFPSPMDLAALLCACRDRRLPFKLTAGLHHALRHTDAETGFIHHGFLNVLAATIAAEQGARVPDVGAVLAGNDPVPLIEVARREAGAPRPLWRGFGTCSIAEPLADLIRLRLLSTEEGS